ncbi:hypothetical protein KCU81_g7110, partial [Aureobasidium melanogenum]|uniref:Uncharacterized protein n=1 Tax=Aureobasidium melanogenum (strain CBS 110374) TaxID=1043003 RepID=A0A074VKT5_AURM1
MDSLIVIDDGIPDGTPLVSRTTHANNQSLRPHHGSQARDEQHYHRRTNLLEQLKSDLDLLQIDTSAIDASDFEWLPKSGFDHEMLDNMRACPILTTNEELADILDLQLSTPDSPPLPTGTHYYSRAWSFRHDELLAVIRYMKNDDHFSQETRTWQSILDAHHDEPGIIYTIRYIGSVQGPRRPINRYQEDLDLRTSGLLAEFSRAISAVCPRVETEAEVFLISGASLHETISSERKENVERVLIAFFDHASLLNRQPGGYLVSYIPSEVDLQAFHDLHTNIGAQFSSRSTPVPLSVERSIEEHFVDLQAFANANPQLCGTTRHPITDELRSIMVRQATPREYRGFTLAVFVGKDAPVESFTSPTVFLDERTHAGGFMRQIVQSIAQSEGSNYQKILSAEAICPYKEIFCFVDLWPWLNHDHLAPAARYLRAYLQLVKPLIVPVFGLQTSDLTLSNFDADCDRRLHALSPVVAVPSIQYHDCPRSNEMHDPDSAFIAIPAFHPGRDKHGSDGQPIRRLIDLSTRYMYLAVQVGMDVLDGFADDAAIPDRLILCQEILRRLRNLSHDNRFFLNLLAQSKADAESALRQSMTRSETENTRSMLNAEACEVLVSFGLAEGEPDSLERAVQVEQLWHANIPQLHMSIPHQATFKDAWKRQFMQLRSRQSLLLAAVTGMDPGIYEQTIISILRPQWQLPDSWLHNQSFTVEFGLWIHRGEPGSLKNKNLFPDRALSAFDLQAKPISNIVLYLPKAAVTKSVSETRALIYTKLGIDLVDGRGQAFRTERSGGAALGVTIPKQTLLSNETTKQLWLAVLEAHSIDPELELVDSDDDEAAQDWGHKGTGMLSARAKSITPRQHLPPRPNDALYPLYIFLQQEFPQGGNYDLASVDKYCDSKEHTRAFVRFLKTASFRKHPFAADWLEKLDRSFPSTGILTSNLPLLRNVKKVQRPTHNRDEYLVIGPPSSAVSDPFNIQHEQCCIPADVLKAWRKNGKKPLPAESSAKKRTSKYPVSAPQKRSKQRK